MPNQREFFYVAITRAAEKLSLIGASKFDEKSWFGQIGLPLAEGLYQKERYQVRHWKETPLLEAFKSEEVTHRDRPVKLKIPLTEVATQLTVTQIVQAQENLKTAEPRILSFTAQLESQQRGQALHYLFEQIKLVGDQDIKKLAQLVRHRFALRNEIDPTWIEKTLALKTPPLRELIARGNPEWPFIFRESGVTVKGQIDLWGEIGGEVWLIDYKSMSKFTDENLGKAQAQLELYALAVNKAGVPWEKMRLAVVAPFQAQARVVPLSAFSEVRGRLIGPVRASGEG